MSLRQKGSALIGMLCLVPVGCLQSCGGTSGKGGTATPVIRSLSVSGPSELFALGQQVAWQATESLSDGTTREGTVSVTWTSSDPSVATVNNSGLVTAVARGTAEISAAIQGVNASAPVAVEPPAWTLVGVPTVGQPDATTDRLLVDPRDERLMYTGTDKGLYVTRDGGASWERPLTGFVPTIRFDPSNADRLYAVVSRRTLVRSDDRGRSFVTLKTFDDFVISMVIRPDDPRTMWLAYAGATWTRFTFGVPGALIPWDIQLDSATGTMYVGTEVADHPQPYHPQFFTSPDEGQTWLDATGIMTWHVVRIAVDSDTHRVLALTEGPGLYRSMDFARTWTRLSSGPSIAMTVDAHEANRIFGGTVVVGAVTGGAFVSVDGGARFTAYGLDGQPVNDLYLNGSSTRLYAASYGSGLYVTDVRAPR